MTIENRGVALRYLETGLTSGAVGLLPDGLLLERFLAGRGDADSSAAFAVLVEPHGPMVFRVCREVLRDLHDAEDASQATFLVLAKTGGSIRRVDSLASWLFGVALRVAAKAKAAAARRRSIERRGSQMKTRSEGDQRGRLFHALYEELDRLPERYRAPIVLCHLEGLSNEQAAGQLGLPVRTMQRQLARGRQRLRNRLAHRDLDHTFGLLGSGIAAHAVPELWLEATLRAASGLAAGHEIAAVASTSVVILTQGMLTTVLIGRLKIVAAGVMAASCILAWVGASSAVAARRRGAPIPVQTEAGKAADTSAAGIGLWIKGIVVDTSGQPVGGARVTTRAGARPHFVTSKPDGTFAISCDETAVRYISLLATADGGARQGVFRFNDERTGPKDGRTLARIVLKAARNVLVSVVDARRAPVEGARVFLLDMAYAVDEGRTDARGEITLRTPADAIMHWILGYKPGVGFDYFENYPFMPSGWSALPERADLVLDGTHTVRVRVIDSGDHPVTGVEIAPPSILTKGKLSGVNFFDSPAKARTDAQGIATFDWLPVDIRARMNLVAATPGYSAQKWPVYDPDAPDIELTVRLLRDTPISGKVTRPDGSPAGGILVIAECMAYSFPPGAGRARTAADGSYRMEVPSKQPYAVYVADDEWTARRPDILSVREGKPATGVDLRLQRGTLIRGQATFGEPPQPAPGLALTLHTQREVLPGGVKPVQPLMVLPNYVAETDQDGRYRFRVGAGEYLLMARDSQGVTAKPELLNIDDGQEIKRDFKLARPVLTKGTIRGVVRSGGRDGATIARAIVVEEPIDGRNRASQAFADGDGRFELPRAFGRSLVYARDRAGSLAGIANLGDDENGEIAIVVRPAAIANGRVVDGAGVPYDSVRVGCAVSPDVEIGDDFEGATQWVIADGQGRFMVGGLPPGMRCTVFAVDPGGAGTSRKKRFKVIDTKPIDLGDVVMHPR